MASARDAFSWPAILTSGLLLASPAVGGWNLQDPTGVWNLTFNVGHIGEGLRTVVIEVGREGDTLTGLISGRQNRMLEVDEIGFEDGVLTVWYGSYEYTLSVEGDTATGSVSSPTGVQEVVAKRQTSRMLAGDDPPPMEKTWRGELAREGDRFVLRTRRATFPFENAASFSPTLEPLLGQTIVVSGLWIVDKIRIETIEPAPSPPSR